MAIVDKYGGKLLCYRFLEGVANDLAMRFQLGIAIRFAEHLALTVLLCEVTSDQIDCLALRDPRKQAPKALTIGEIGKPPLCRRAEKTVQRAKCHIFFVNGSSRYGSKFLPGDIDKNRKAAVPKSTGGLVVALFYLINPT